MMFMANYCGNFHATGRGREIKWEISSDAKSNLAATSILEAKWGPDGALCMSSPRELYQDGTTQTVPHDPQADLLTMKEECPGCTTPEAWANEMRKCESWKNRDKDKVKPPKPVVSCKECETAECKGVVLHSYVVPKTVP